MRLKVKNVSQDELKARYKEIDSFMKHNYNHIYRRSGAFCDKFPLNDKPVTRAYIAISKAIDMLPEIGQMIIHDRYIEPVPTYETIEKSKGGRTRYYRLTKITCYMFSKYLEETCKEEHIDYKAMIS